VVLGAAAGPAPALTEQELGPGLLERLRRGGVERERAVQRPLVPASPCTANP
jgi:hypothetical protein